MALGQVEPKQSDERSSKRSYRAVGPKQSLKTEQEVGNKMINEIEKNGQNDNEDINLEYFVGGQKKFYVPYHTHNNLTDNFSKEILMAQNMLLRIKLKNEMGKRIEELELNEIILKAKNTKLENENEKLNQRIRKLERQLEGKDRVEDPTQRFSPPT